VKEESVFLLWMWYLDIRILQVALSGTQPNRTRRVYYVLGIYVRGCSSVRWQARASDDNVSRSGCSRTTWTPAFRIRWKGTSWSKKFSFEYSIVIEVDT